eukprot:SAG25_NODE_2255_length_1786_cov_1.634855_1_plen_185_part_00
MPGAEDEKYGGSTNSTALLHSQWCHSLFRDELYQSHRGCLRFHMGYVLPQHGLSDPATAHGSSRHHGVDAQRTAQGIVIRHGFIAQLLALLRVCGTHRYARPCTHARARHVKGYTDSTLHAATVSKPLTEASVPQINPSSAANIQGRWVMCPHQPYAGLTCQQGWCAGSSQPARHTDIQTHRLV